MPTAHDEEQAMSELPEDYEPAEVICEEDGQHIPNPENPTTSVCGKARRG